MLRPHDSKAGVAGPATTKRGTRRGRCPYKQKSEDAGLKPRRYVYVTAS